jgi:hypothetical protein
VVGDLNREDIPTVVNHILFLVKAFKRIRTNFNTREAYRIRTKLLDSALHKALVLKHDPNWKEIWECIRIDLGPRNQDSFDPSKNFSSSDTFSESRRKENSVCESRHYQTDVPYLFKL